MSRFALVLAVVTAGCGVSISGAPSDHATGNDPGQPGDTIDAGDGTGNTGSDDPAGPGSGSDDPGSDSGSDDPNTLSAKTFLHDIGEHLCNEAFKCLDDFPGSGGDFSDLWGVSKTACYAIMDAYYEIDGVADEVANGNIAYDENAADCLASITYGSCTNFWDNGATFGQACSQALVGSANAGDACEVDFDCSGQLLCHQHVCQ